MIIDKISFNDKTNKNLINIILDKKIAGYVIENFLTIDELLLFRNNAKKIESDCFNPYDGYKCIPRAFNYIENSNSNIYKTECKRVLDNTLKDIIRKKFEQLFQSFSNQITFKLTDINFPFAKSMTTVSYRFLEPDKGKFLIHCGLQFDEFNKTFYNTIRNDIDNTIQLSFFILIQKPETNCDIKVFEANWKDYKQIENHKYFIDKNGVKISVDNFNFQDVNMNEGDLLIFDGGNYWHLVPSFKGNIQRITMGGFISKFLNSNTVSIWA